MNHVRYTLQRRRHHHRPLPVLKLVALNVPLRSFEDEALRRSSLRFSFTPMRSLRSFSLNNLTSSCCFTCCPPPPPSAPLPSDCCVVVVVLPHPPSFDCTARSTRLRLLRWSVVSWCRFMTWQFGNERQGGLYVHVRTYIICVGCIHCLRDWL